ncbi:uncharacterized protein LOC129961096 [Argiope bruennichi]|uniref:uncharacterized protein LOC129961096 n=1 Tax=Argiope bruennichi TaxID=94029 RepID=UPI00249473DA|nr:uncharacterized protein LOC129961096 [Argiope bruennichi]XP_055930893.1 uncharacterized protein LOC129961096 [Argiope bruennichi]
MILLVCPCLNIRVHGRGSTFNLEDASKLNLPESIMNDSFFESQVYPVTLDLAGVTMSQKVLCKVRCVENWTVTTCACCTMDVFAKRIDDNDTVLVSSRVETNANYISSLMDSDRYSSLFKLILPDINDNFIQNNIGIEFQNGNIDSSIEHVQTQVSNYLKAEQRAMEERIRLFTEEQQSIYSNLLQKVRKNKQAMVYLMIKCKESQNQIEGDVVSESSVGSPSVLNKDSANDSSTSTDSAFDRSETNDPSTDAAVKQQKLRALRRTVSNPARSRTKVKRELKRAPASIDVGGVFDMEEFETKESYSCNSDEETDDSENETSTDVAQGRPEQFSCATSLPMSIPTLSNYPHFSLHEEEEKEPSPKAPEDIAASMRALACSVRDGTEMFGELPRRRLNTGELLAFRPF